MINNLMHSIDVRQAHASVNADRVRILKMIEGDVGLDALNKQAIGALTGALRGAMDQRAVLAAALGDTGALDALQGDEELGEALVASAGGGLMDHQPAINGPLTGY